MQTHQYTIGDGSGRRGSVGEGRFIGKLNFANHKSFMAHISEAMMRGWTLLWRYKLFTQQIISISRGQLKGQIGPHGWSSPVAKG